MVIEDFTSQFEDSSHPSVFDFDLVDKKHRKRMTITFRDIHPKGDESFPPRFNPVFTVFKNAIENSDADLIISSYYYPIEWYQEVNVKDKEIIIFGIYNPPRRRKKYFNEIFEQVDCKSKQFILNSFDGTCVSEYMPRKIVLMAIEKYFGITIPLHNCPEDKTTIEMGKELDKIIQAGNTTSSKQDDKTGKDGSHFGKAAYEKKAT